MIKCYSYFTAQVIPMKITPMAIHHKDHFDHFLGYGFNLSQHHTKDVKDNANVRTMYWVGKFRKVINILHLVVSSQYVSLESTNCDLVWNRSIMSLRKLEIREIFISPNAPPHSTNQSTVCGAVGRKGNCLTGILWIQWWVTWFTRAQCQCLK